MLERIRSTSLALLGLCTAIGLGLVAFALQQGWPVAPNLPIPGVSGGEHGAVAKRTVVAEATDREPVMGQGGAPRAVRSSGSAGAQSAPADSRLAAARGIATPGAGPAGPAEEVPPPGEGAPGSSPESPQQASPPTSPTPTPAASPPPAASATPPVTSTATESSEEGESKGEGRWHSRGKSDWKGKEEAGGWRNVSGEEPKDRDRGSDDGWKYKPPPAAKPKEDAAEPPAPSYGSGYDDEGSDEGEPSSGWDYRDHGRGHRR